MGAQGNAVEGRKSGTLGFKVYRERPLGLGGRSISIMEGREESTSTNPGKKSKEGGPA